MSDEQECDVIVQYDPICSCILSGFATYFIENHIFTKQNCEYIFQNIFFLLTRQKNVFHESFKNKK